MNSTVNLLSLATPDDIPLLQSIARNTWPLTFKDILSREQIEYMITWMYGRDTLAGLMYNPNFLFFLINQNAGLTAIELHYEDQPVTKLHKIYILPQHQGKGLGVQTVDALEAIARKEGDKTMVLNVNKKNPATFFYEKCGFTRWKSEVIDIGNGYVMDDYVYRKEL